MLVRFLNGTARHIENLFGADLRGADLRGVDLRGADMSYASLYGADLFGADLRGADLRGVDLSCANLYRANLYCANLFGADLSGTNLSGANLSRANLYRARLCGANLYCADLSGANLSHAKFSYVLLMSSISWGYVSNKLCLEMMRRDALITGVEAMSKWAKGGSCPFLSVSETRAYQFKEDRKLWRKGKPQMTDRELWVALCKEKNIKI